MPLMPTDLSHVGDDQFWGVIGYYFLFGEAYALEETSYDCGHGLFCELFVLCLYTLQLFVNSQSFLFIFSCVFLKNSCKEFFFLVNGGNDTVISDVSI